MNNRTKPLILVLAGLGIQLLPLAALAQGFQFGIQAGANLTQATYDSQGYFEGTQDGWRFGFFGGVIVSLTPAEQGDYSFESGLLFQKRGGKTTIPLTAVGEHGEPIDQGTDDGFWKLSYLSIPLQAKARLGVGGTRPYVKAGVEIGIPLAGEADMPDLYATEPGARRVDDIKDDLASPDFCLRLAFGLELPDSPLRPFAEVSYSHGLGDFLDVADAAFDVKMRHRILSLSGGVWF